MPYLTIFGALNSSGYMMQFCFEDGLLWFKAEQGLLRLHPPTSLRNATLRKVDDHVLPGQGWVRTVKEKPSLSQSIGLAQR
ncbi:hypothetical protein cyc_03179 [Cyclospora cayetanensis]|uniref:Uncharacterized protein n=1 Tax=Cyclospora cayetanensis TaxID=88456 RepID=A0A1D3D9H5_9EIME|nr:hypothetical protein cyc_03179 [Cyclospora cayetanensis]